MTYALGGGRHGHRHGGGFHGHRHGGFHGWRGWGWRGGFGPGYVDYYSYSPCAECWGQPPALYANCLRYYGCSMPTAAMLGLGQSVPGPATMAGIGGALVIGAGFVWWLKSRRKKRSS